MTPSDPEPPVSPVVQPARTRASRSSAPRCPECGEPLRVTQNPYYGVGLAVHRWLYSCEACPWIRFAVQTPTGLVVDTCPRDHSGALGRIARRIRDRHRRRDSA